MNTNLWRRVRRGFSIRDRLGESRAWVYGGLVRTTWAAALAWRLRRHHLEPGSEAASVEDVVERLVALPAWSGDPQLAIRSRLGASGADSVDDAVAAGRIIKVFAFRGATHLMTPQQAADHLALRAVGRMWERASWRSHYALEPEDWPPLRAAVREALSDGPLTPEEVAAQVTTDARFAHLREALSRFDTFLKPFFWQGDVCFGPLHDGRPTMQALADNPRWPGIPDLDDAGRRAVIAYLGAYGPAPVARLQYWLGEGLGAGPKRIEGWVRDLDDRLVRLDIEGAETLVLDEHVDELSATAPSQAVRLLPGHDQWVLGPGTADAVVVPAAARTAVTRGANLVLVGGVFRGSWRLRDGKVVIETWTDDEVPREPLASEVARIEGLFPAR